MISPPKTSSPPATSSKERPEERPENQAIDITGIPSGRALEVPAGNLEGAPGDVLPEPAGSVSKRDTSETEEQDR